MAPYVCDNQDGTLAAVVITIIDTGEVMALCGPCSGPWALGYAVSAAEAQGLSVRQLLGAMADNQEAMRAAEGQPADQDDGATETTQGSPDGSTAPPPDATDGAVVEPERTGPAGGGTPVPDADVGQVGAGPASG